MLSLEKNLLFNKETPGIPPAAALKNPQAGLLPGCTLVTLKNK
jgi:hypothetical protein